MIPSSVCHPKTNTQLLSMPTQDLISTQTSSLTSTAYIITMKYAQHCGALLRNLMNNYKEHLTMQHGDHLLLDWLYRLLTITRSGIVVNTNNTSKTWMTLMKISMLMTRHDGPSSSFTGNPQSDRAIYYYYLYDICKYRN